MKTILSLRLVVPLFILFSTVSSMRAETVSRKAPPIYDEVMKAELTPVESLLDQIDYFTPEESDHACVMQEAVVYVDADGRIYEVYHNAYKALSNGDLDDIGSDLFTFRPDNAKIHLIKAETILPDGTVCAVPEEGIMFQAHQQDQDSMIFSGRKQLRLIYPQVSKGSVTHCIVMIERDGARIPGQFMDRYSWERSWQTHLKRAVVFLPEAYEKRLNTAVLGSGVPEDRKTVLPSGWTRHEWKRVKLPLRKWEYLDGPVLQTGPALFMSTLRDWNEFGEWYAERIRESSEVTEAVHKVAVEWTDGAESEDEIIGNLAFHVANDIRYVSLEFGVGGLQPQPVANVLENRFGDCKDKANFLRVLLKENGIEAHVVLINTHHGGTVDKRCADFSYFNHAILRVEKSNGETLICDPTVKYGWAGLLYPSIANRQALVVDEESSECTWVQTPQAGAGHLAYDMDLKLSRAGELSGWFAIKGTGYYATSLSRRFEATERESLKYDVEKYLGYFYDASSVIDFELERTSPETKEFFLKTYFICPATGQAKLTVGWPEIKWLLPRLGEDKDVKREAFIWNDQVDVSLQVALPDTMTATSRPEPWSIQSSGFSAQGRWTVEPDRIVATLHGDVSKTHIAPPDFPKLYNAVEATSHWLEEVVILGQGDGVVAENAPETPAGELGDAFVLMSSGEGQIELVDHLYPGSTHAAERRLALAKTKAWFPKDLSTQFECDVRLGWLAYSDENYDEALKIAREAVRDYGDAVDVATRGWALYLEALALEQLEQVDEALKICAELESDPEMNEYRRGYAAYQYGRMMREKDAAVARDYYLKALGYATYNEEWMLQHCYGFLLENMDFEALAGFLNEMYEVEPERAKSIVTWLGQVGVESSGQLLGLVNAAKINQVLDEVDFAKDTIDGQLLGQLQELEEHFAGYAKAREVLSAHLASNSYALWQAEPDKDRTFDEYAEDIKQAISDNDIELSSRLALWRILQLEPEVEFAEWVWDAARMVDYLYRNDARDLEPLLNCLFDLRQYLPERDSGTLDLEFIRAESLAREGDPDQALEIYQTLQDMELESHWWKSLYSHWTKVLAAVGDSEKAIEVYGLARANLKDDVEYLPLAIHGVYALLEEGRKEEALAWLHELYAVCEVKGWDGEFVSHLEEWIELEEEERLAAFWELQSEWMPRWNAAVEAAGMPESDEAMQTIYSDFGTAGRDIGTAMVQKDHAGVRKVLEAMLISARWHPTGILEAQSMMSYLASQYPDAEEAFYRCELALDSEAFQLNPTNQYSCRVNDLAALIKLEEYDALMERAEEYFQHQVIKDDFDIYSRYGGLAAINLNRTGTEWVGRMEALFEDAECYTDPYAVNILSLLYRQEGRTEDEQNVLKRFLADYAGDNEQMRDMLKGRLSSLEELAEGNANLTLAVNEWLENYSPSWLSLFDDPVVGEESVAELSRKVGEITESDEGPEYQNAFYLLGAAKDERLDSVTREKAFYHFLFASIGPTWQMERNLTMMTAVAGDDRFSDTTREICASFVGNMAMTMHVHGYLEEHLLPEAKGLEVVKELEENRELMVGFSNLDGYSAEAISTWMDSVREAGKPLDRRTVYLLGRAFDELCQLGAVELAEKQIAAAGKLKFESTSNGSTFALQLEWQQKVDRVKELVPLTHVLETFFMATLKPDCEPPVYEEIVFAHMPAPKDRRSANRALLQYGVYDHASTMFWNELSDSEYHTANICVDAENLQPLLESALEVCSSDYQYQVALMTIGNLFDTDNPACQEIFESLTEPLSLNPDLRKTHQYLLWHAYRFRVRGGDHARALADLQSEQRLPMSQVHGLMMNLLMLEENHGSLNEYLNGASPDLLLADTHLIETMRAFKLCERDSAFNLLQGKAQESMRERMAGAMQSGDRAELYYALEYAQVLGAEDDLSDEWAAQVKRMADRDNFAYLQMKLCYFSEDWPGTQKAAQTVVDYAPLHYDSYFYLGKALIRQQEYDAGIKALKPFLDYCKDSLDYREALELEKEAKSNL